MSFHSGTDDNDLIDNADNYPYYLSVVVNNKLEWDIKISRFFKYDIPAETKTTTYYIKNDDGEWTSLTKTEESPASQGGFVYFFKGVLVEEEEGSMDEDFLNRIKEVDKPVVTPAYTASTYNYTAPSNGQIFKSTYNICNAIDACEILGITLKKDFPNLYAAVNFLNTLLSKVKSKEKDALEAKIEKAVEKWHSNKVTEYTLTEFTNAFCDRVGNASNYAHNVEDIINNIRITASYNEKYSKTDGEDTLDLAIHIFTFGECSDIFQAATYIKEHGFNQDASSCEEYISAVVGYCDGKYSPEKLIELWDTFYFKCNVVNMAGVRPYLQKIKLEKETGITV